jgi:hypothetical protein
MVKIASDPLTPLPPMEFELDFGRILPGRQVAIYEYFRRPQASGADLWSITTTDGFIWKLAENVKEIPPTKVAVKSLEITGCLGL